MEHMTADLDIRAERYDSPVARRLIGELQSEYVERYGGPDATEVDPEEFAPPGGGFLVAYLCGQPIGCGGFRRFDDQTAEVKRMFVLSGWRRQGLARELLKALESAIVVAGYRNVRLMTGGEQPEAIRLYQTSGYRVTADGYGIYKDEAGARFFSKALISETR
jgi:GNAT superfamily N-acetyltransferase